MSDKAQDLQAAIGALPAPLNTDSYTRLRRGIFESEDVDVMVNGQGDFAFLHPRPAMDYTQYKPRFKQLGLKSYRAQNDVNERRLAKIEAELPEAGRFLEIGGSDGGFLEAVRSSRPKLECACLEPDMSTKPQRDALSWMAQFQSFDDARANGKRFDAIGFFHVFEHIEQPEEFLCECATLLAEEARIIIEVPALTDPLISLYDVPAYQAFYFQRQHPYVYSSASLERLLGHNGFAVQKVIPHQRYGLENHLTWLTRGEPGGSEEYRQLYAPIDKQYRELLEREAKADAIIVIAKAKS